MHAAFYGYPDAANVLLASGASVNATDNSGWTPLMCSAAAYYENDARTACLLLAAGADAHVKNSDGKTALMLADEHHNWRTRQLLKDKVH